MSNPAAQTKDDERGRPADDSAATHGPGGGEYHVLLRIALRRMVNAAVDAGGAEFGGLALFSPEGDISEYISVGRPGQVAAAGALLSPLGIVDLVLDDPRSIRLSERVSPPASGLLPRPAPVASVLGVPVSIGDELLGCLYLCNHESGLFGESDELILEEWAAAVALAADRGRLLGEVNRRRDWSAAAAEVAASLVTSADSDAMDLFTDRLHALAKADIVALLQVSQVTGSLVVSSVRGLEEDTLDGAVLAMLGSRARGVFERQHPILIDDCVEAGLSILREGVLGPGMVVPLVVPHRAESILLVARVPGGRQFSVADLEMTADFAELATVALALATPHAGL